jgi:hypothetical protein
MLVTSMYKCVSLDKHFCFAQQVNQVEGLGRPRFAGKERTAPHGKNRPQSCGVPITYLARSSGSKPKISRTEYFAKVRKFWRWLEA